MSCSRHSAGPQIFFGKCRIEVVSKTSGAEILIDGIVAGHEHVKVEIPCGEKQVRVVKHGLVPYEAYLPVTVEQPLKVTVELSEFKMTPDFALSREVLALARAGRRIRNPWTATPAELAADEKEAAEAAAAVPAAKAASAAGEASAPAAGGGTWSTNADDWR